MGNYFPQPYYFYNAGDVCSSFTGGYKAEGTYSAYSVNDNNKLYFNSTKQSSNASGIYGYLRTVNKVPIKSGHKKLICKVSSATQIYGQLYFYVSSSATSNPIFEAVICSYATGQSSASNENIEIDVSSLDGNYFIGFRIASGGGNGEHATVYIDKIWAE